MGIDLLRYSTQCNGCGARCACFLRVVRYFKKSMIILIVRKQGKVAITSADFNLDFYIRSYLYSIRYKILPMLPVDREVLYNCLMARCSNFTFACR